MFDRIFKLCLVIILAFTAYTFYLYVSYQRYSHIGDQRILDKKAGIIKPNVEDIENDRFERAFEKRQQMKKSQKSK